MNTKYLLAAICCLFFMAGCDSYKKYESSKKSSGTGWIYNEKSYGGYGKSDNDNKRRRGEEAVTDKKDKQDSRMMIYNASITIEADKPDTISARVSALAKKYEGYVLSSSNYQTTIRIKSATTKNIMQEIESLGKVTNRSISGSDVTDEFTDYQIRLENAERSRARYLQLLEKAQTVEETLKVERELERLNGEIDLLKGKMNRIDHLVDFTTITVYHHQKVKPGVLGYFFISVYKGIKWLFVRN